MMSCLSITCISSRLNALSPFAWRFHCAIMFGWTSCLAACSPSVLSPTSASKATRALNPAENVRRFRIAPAPPRPQLETGAEVWIEMPHQAPARVEVFGKPHARLISSSKDQDLLRRGSVSLQRMGLVLILGHYRVLDERAGGFRGHFGVEPLALGPLPAPLDHLLLDPVVLDRKTPGKFQLPDFPGQPYPLGHRSDEPAVDLADPLP